MYHTKVQSNEIYVHEKFHVENLRYRKKKIVSKILCGTVANGMLEKKGHTQE